jgi:hypothetical protein
MRTEKQVVFLTHLFLNDQTLEVKVWDSRSDAMRAVRGDRERIVARSVLPDSGKGPYRKPPPPAKKSARARQ